jgi:hypothetical protein
MRFRLLTISIDKKEHNIDILTQIILVPPLKFNWFLNHKCGHFYLMGPNIKKVQQLARKWLQTKDRNYDTKIINLRCILRVVGSCTFMASLRC